MFEKLLLKSLLNYLALSYTFLRKTEGSTKLAFMENVRGHFFYKIIIADKK